MAKRSAYRFDYSKAKPNRFAARMKDAPLVAVIDPDVANGVYDSGAGEYSLAGVDFRHAKGKNG